MKRKIYLVIENCPGATSLKLSRFDDLKSAKNKMKDLKNDYLKEGNDWVLETEDEKEIFLMSYDYNYGATISLHEIFNGEEIELC